MTQHSNLKNNSIIDFNGIEIKLITPFSINSFCSRTITDQAIKSITRILLDLQLSEEDIKRITSVVDFVLLMHPFVDEEKRLIILTKYYMVLALIDDLIESTFKRIKDDEYRCIVVQFKNALDRLTSDDQQVFMSEWRPCVQWAYAVLEDMCQGFSKTWRKRLVTSWKLFVDVCFDEMTNPEKIISYDIFCKVDHIIFCFLQ